MKVFISHAFDEVDVQFGNMLKEDLAAAGMNGYMAENVPQYNLPVADKIRRAIEESDWLVAIITENGQASASVHEEIGYALGQRVEVMLMLKKGVGKSGVLIYGREPLVFTPGEFKRHSLEAVEFIKNASAPSPKRRLSGEAMRLQASRNVASASSPLFAQNEHFTRLHSPVPDDAKKPVVLFTACPHNLAASADVTSNKFVDWAKSITSLEVDGRQINVQGTEYAVDVGTLIFAKIRAKRNRLRRALLYRELQSSGLFEYGTAHTFFHINRRRRLEMDVCHMIGDFWAFLAYVRLFYKKIGLDSAFTVLLSIKNSRNAALQNDGIRPLGLTSPVRIRAPSPCELVTHHTNIQFSHDFGSASGMTNKDIAQVAKRAATYICNAYGATTPGCYNENGTFSWLLWEHALQAATRGG